MKTILFLVFHSLEKNDDMAGQWGIPQEFIGPLGDGWPMRDRASDHRGLGLAEILEKVPLGYGFLQFHTSGGFL